MTYCRYRQNLVEFTTKFYEDDNGDMEILTLILLYMRSQVGLSEYVEVDLHNSWLYKDGRIEEVRNHVEVPVHGQRLMATIWS